MAIAGDDSQRLDNSPRRIGFQICELCTIGLENLPDEGLLRGQVGTIVESLAPGVWEVEFSDDSGRTYGSLALRADQLMRLHHEPSHPAA